MVSLTKGIEQGTRLRMSQVVHEALPGHLSGVLTGPNLAKEILAGHAAAAVVAMTRRASSPSEVQRVFGRSVPVYVNHDVIGSEVGGVEQLRLARAQPASNGSRVAASTASMAANGADCPRRVFSACCRAA